MDIVSTYVLLWFIHSLWEERALYRRAQSDIKTASSLEQYHKMSFSKVLFLIVGCLAEKYHSDVARNYGTAYGDPHFMVHTEGHEPICFDYNPLNLTEITLLFDPVTSLVITVTDLIFSTAIKNSNFGMRKMEQKFFVKNLFSRNNFRWKKFSTNNFLGKDHFYYRIFDVKIFRQNILEEKFRCRKYLIPIWAELENRIHQGYNKTFMTDKGS